MSCVALAAEGTNSDVGVQDPPQALLPTIKAPRQLLRCETRQVIELLPEHEKKPYRFLELYCHLCVHATLSTSPVAIFALKHIANALSDAAENGGRTVADLFQSVIPATLAPDQIRTPLRKLWADHGLNQRLWDDDAAWPQFVRTLCYSILYKPVEIDPAIVEREISSMGGANASGPPPVALTEHEKKHRPSARALEYFRVTAHAMGAPGSVPVSLQLLHRNYPFVASALSASPGVSEGYPGEFVWGVGIYNAVLLAPFSATGSF